nr:hypothetical protein B0A51_18308 [Rachicladosporium sp. CCFEE 5018]
MATQVCTHCGGDVDIEMIAAPAYSRNDQPQAANDAAIALALQEANAPVERHICPSCRNIAFERVKPASNALRWWYAISWLALFVLLIWTLAVAYTTNSNVKASSQAAKYSRYYTYTVTSTRTTTSIRYGYETITSRITITACPGTSTTNFIVPVQTATSKAG